MGARRLLLRKKSATPDCRTGIEPEGPTQLAEQQNEVPREQRVLRMLPDRWQPLPSRVTSELAVIGLGDRASVPQPRLLAGVRINRTTSASAFPSFKC